MSQAGFGALFAQHLGKDGLPRTTRPLKQSGSTVRSWGNDSLSLPWGMQATRLLCLPLNAVSFSSCWACWMALQSANYEDGNVVGRAVESAHRTGAGCNGGFQH